MGSLVKISTVDGVMRITLARPDKKNALNRVLVDELTAAIRRAADDVTVGVVALQGEGSDFCAGADLSALRDLLDAGVEENRADALALGDVFIALRHLPKPVVAIVKGRALGGGAGLALACDMVWCQEGATIGFTELRVGFVPAIVMAILRRQLGAKRAFEMAVVADPISADEALGWGIVNAVIPADRFEPECDERLRALATRPATSVALTKRVISELEGVDFDESIRRGAEINVTARMNPELREGIRVFLNRGKK